MKLIILALITMAGMAFAAPQTFDFKDPKGINNAGFKLDAPLESINGSASGISGTVIFDPANPGATKGKILVATGVIDVHVRVDQEANRLVGNLFDGSHQLFAHGSELSVNHKHAIRTD